MAKRILVDDSAAKIIMDILKNKSVETNDNLEDEKGNAINGADNKPIKIRRMVGTDWAKAVKASGAVPAYSPIDDDKLAPKLVALKKQFADNIGKGLEKARKADKPDAKVIALYGHKLNSLTAHTVSNGGRRGKKARSTESVLSCLSAF